MTVPYLSGDTIDDLMRLVVERILLDGEETRPTQGPAVEVAGILLEIKNPRARISRTETRGKPLSCLGELCWYLAKSNDLAFIQHYISRYKKSADGDVIHGGYGPRLFNWRTINQFKNVEERLKRNPDSRRAVIQLFDGCDIAEKHNDVPCTCTLQFMVRQNQLHLVTYMRSNDAFWGLPHDVFCFTMLQEIMARKLSIEIGTYKHMVGSLHLYVDLMEKARLFLNEGWQATSSPMPPMPVGDPSTHISKLLEAERTIRTGSSFHSDSLNEMEPYWADLARLLLALQHSRHGDIVGLKELLNTMHSDIYDIYIQDRISELS